MLLTLKQPSTHGFKSFHEYSPPTPPSTSRFSPALIGAGTSYPPQPPASKQSAEQHMSTSHRGLPPPAAMMPQREQPQNIREPMREQIREPLRDPVREPLRDVHREGQPLVHGTGALPSPPQQWQGAEESMRCWLHAKSEEDKRRQEEERTKQENLRLEQRRVEQDMLRTSLSGGIPPYLIPMVFVGLAGGNISSSTTEWAQHFISQTHQLQQQQIHQQQSAIATQPASPALRREDRQITHPYASQHPAPAPLPSTPAGAISSQQSSVFVPSYTLSPNSRSRASLPGPSALSRPAASAGLSRLNTGEMQIVHPPQSAPMPHTAAGQQQHSFPPQQAPPQQSEPEPQEQSPGIYFHHWQPPTSQTTSSGGNQPSTPSEPTASSPKKRKSQGPHQPAPPPTSQPRYTSPSFSQAGSSMSGPSGTPARKRGGHSRQHSEHGSFEYGRPRARHQFLENEGTTSAGASPDQHQNYSVSTEGPIGGRRSTLQSVREDRSDPRQHSLQHQQPQQHQHQPSLPPPPGPSQQQQPPPPPQHGYGEFRYSAGSDMRRDIGRGGVRSPDREMSQLRSGKRDDHRE